MVPLLNDRLGFPDPRHACDEGPCRGLVAIGGDLSAPRLLLAYRCGIYPWSVNPITWWSPDPRGIFELDGFHVSRSLARTLHQQRFEVTFDNDFPGVIRGCAAAPGRDRCGWITPQFIAAYTALYRAGHVHSVECWREGELVGGVYGVTVGGLFAGESMFHLADDASKVALWHLVQHLRERGFQLFDTQMVTTATRPLGAKEIPRDEYLDRLADAVQVSCVF